MKKVNERNTMEDLVEQIVGLIEDEIKYILWVLCYNPKKVFEEYEINEEIDPKFLQKEILKACRNKDEGFIFASEESKLNNFGVNLRISNPIIRDTIIEHCTEIADDATYLRICISNICTRKTSFEYFENRREGFNLLDFSEEEQSFLEREIDTYRIGELLKAIQREKYPKFVPTKTYNESNISKYVMSRNKGEYSDSKLDSLKLIENEELVKTFFIFFTKLQEVGLDPGKVGEKKKEVENFYTLAKASLV